MGLRNLLIHLFAFTVLLFIGFQSYGQAINRDSLTRARQHVMDSTRAAQKRVLDSTRVSRQHILDSTKAVRQKRTDSLAAMRKYKESKKYKDSVTNARQAKLDVIKNARMAQVDSAKAARQHIMDSTLAIRKARTDSIKTVQKRRTDSLAVIRKYRESKRYSDSVVVVRKLKLDSMKTARKVITDSVAAVRKKFNDSATAARKHVMDSSMAVRKQFTDSIKAVRKVRADSLAKVKEQKDKDKKLKDKQKEEKMQLALELKIKKKQQAWSNEKMLKKKWSLPRQAIQNTFTRYNYYFNSDRKMDEALANMQRINKESYDSLLALFPFDPDRDSTVLAPDMDSIIQKASVGIQIHDPRTKWGDDLYLLLGQAYYYKGDYTNAATAFRYIVSLRDKNKKKANSNQRTVTKPGEKGPSIAQADDDKLLDFLKHRSAHNEALLWLARTYTESHQEGNAESVLDLLESDPNMPESLKGRLALERSYIHLSQNNYKEATTHLAVVSKDNSLPDWVRMRAAYLNGQLLQQQGNYDGAAGNFAQVLDLNPKIEMDFYARKNLAYSRMNSGGDQDEAMASLKKVLNDGKYAPYYEQIYYMMGRLAANKGDYKTAQSYLKKSIGVPRSTRKQKAISFAALGNVYYNNHEYPQAKTAYDSSGIFAAAAPGDTLVSGAIRKGMALSNVTKPLNAIKDADSLLTLSSMSSRDQTAAVRKYIKMLAQRRSDSIFAAENAGVQNALQQQGTQSMGGGAGTYVNWYFANPSLLQQGFNEFKRKWGTRPMVDNWRRGASISNFVAAQGSGASSSEDDEEEPMLDENGLPTEASLLAYIPKTPAKQENLRKRNMLDYISLADAYLNQLQDYDQAIATLDTLDRRYPNHPNKAQVLYMRYIVAMKLEKMEAAKAYSASLLRDHADSKWADLVRPKEDGPGLVVSAGNVANFYDEAYGLLMQRQYTDVLQRMAVAGKQYNDPAYKKRFMMMEAIALVGAGNYNKADTMLTDFMSTSPSDSLRSWAEATLAYIKKNRPVAPPPAAIDSSKAAGAAPVGADATVASAADNNTTENKFKRLTPGADAAAANQPPKEYQYKPADEHFVVFSFHKMEPRAMGVKAAIGDFNTFKFGSLGLSVNLRMLTQTDGMIIVQKFKNAGQAKIYLNSLKGTDQVFREYKTGEYSMFLISAGNYSKLSADGATAPYINFYKNNYK